MTLYSTHYEKILLDAIHTWGGRVQEDIAIEEMSELIKAIIKHRRKPGEAHRQEMVEEIADVWIMLDQLEIMYCQDGELQSFIEKKVERLDKLVNGA